MRETEKRGESVSEHAGKSSIAANKKRGAQPVPPWSHPPPPPSRTSALTSSPGTGPGALASSLRTPHLVIAPRSTAKMCIVYRLLPFLEKRGGHGTTLKQLDSGTLTLLGLMPLRLVQAGSTFLFVVFFSSWGIALFSKRYRARPGKAAGCVFESGESASLEKSYWPYGHPLQ